MSDTLRTDAESDSTILGRQCDQIEADFARGLERELNAVSAELAEANKKLTAYRMRFLVSLKDADIPRRNE